MFLILRRCFRQMPSVFVRNFCIVPPDFFFLLWFLPFLPPRVEVYDRILSFANRVGLTVTDFYPTPGSLSTCQYYTELDPYSKNEDGTFKSIYVPKKAHERRLQRALIQFNKKENKPMVIEALKTLGRTDLIKKLL